MYGSWTKNVVLWRHFLGFIWDLLDIYMAKATFLSLNSFLAQYVSPAGDYAACLPCRWLRNMSTLQVISRHVYPAGDYTTCLPCRWLHNMSTLQVIRQHVYPAGDYAACLPFRWLRNMSTLQVITRHVYPSGDYATCLSTLQVVAWQLIGETKINYNLSLEVLDQNIQTSFYLPFVSCSPLPSPIYLVGNAFLYVYLFCLSVFLSVSYKRHKGWTEKCTNVSVSTTIHNKKKEEGGWG